VGKSGVIHPYDGKDALRFGFAIDRDFSFLEEFRKMKKRY
jgi:hypothetical protein